MPGYFDASRAFVPFEKKLDGGSRLGFVPLCLSLGVSPLAMGLYLRRTFGLSGKEVVALYRAERDKNTE